IRRQWNAYSLDAGGRERIPYSEQPAWLQDVNPPGLSFREEAEAVRGVRDRLDRHRTVLLDGCGNYVRRRLAEREGRMQTQTGPVQLNGQPAESGPQVIQPPREPSERATVEHAGHRLRWSDGNRVRQRIGEVRWNRGLQPVVRDKPWMDAQSGGHWN